MAQQTVLPPRPRPTAIGPVLTFRGAIAVSLLRLRAVLEQLNPTDRAIALTMIEDLVEMQREDIRACSETLPF